MSDQHSDAESSGGEDNISFVSEEASDNEED